MDVDSPSVLRLVGIEPQAVYPSLADCPLCRATGKLEIRSPFFLVCRGCWFLGDVLHLVAQFRSCSLAEAVADLTRRGLLEMKPEETKAYLEDAAVQNRLRKLWRERSDYLKAHGDLGSMYAVIAGFSGRPTHQAMAAMTPHVCYLRREDLVDAGFEPPEHAEEVWKWWGKYSALALPVWDGPQLNGFYLLTTRGSNYLGLANTVGGAAFGLVGDHQSEVITVVDSPELAVRFGLWSIIETGKLWPFICNVGLRDKTEHYRGRRVVYWASSPNLRHYLRGLSVSSAQALLPMSVTLSGEKGLPCEGSFGVFRSHLKAADCVHKEVAILALACDADTVRSVLSSHPVDAGDRARILSYVQGDDNKLLNDLFGESQVEPVVSVGGHAVADTPRGWVCRGKLISDVKLYLEQIRPVGNQGEALVKGTVVYVTRKGDRHVIAFEDQLTVVRKNTADWLQRKVIASTAHLPVIDSRWKSRLLEIAMEFHAPQALVGAKLYGWEDQVLRMPYFTVDDRGITPTYSLVEGPMMAVPSALSPAEWSAFRHQGFCRAVLALLGNLERTRQGRPGLGLMLVNEPHTVARIAPVFGADILANPSADVLEAHALDCLPVFTTWGPGKLPQLFMKAGPKNCVVSVDRHTAKVSTLAADWLHLKIGDAVDYSALRSVMLILPTLLQNGPYNVEAEDFYRVIGQHVADAIGPDCPGNRIRQAAIDVDQYYTWRNNTAGSRIIELVFYGIDRGDIRPVERPDYVEIDIQEFLRAVSGTAVTIPTADELTASLQEARFLVGADRRSWQISRMAWGMLKSLTASV